MIAVSNDFMVFQRVYISIVSVFTIFLYYIYAFKHSVINFIIHINTTCHSIYLLVPNFVIAVPISLGSYKKKVCFHCKCFHRLSFFICAFKHNVINQLCVCRARPHAVIPCPLQCCCSLIVQYIEIF